MGSENDLFVHGVSAGAVADSAGVKLRPWQEPLSDEAVEWLTVQFARHKARIESVWGPAGHPWSGFQ